DLRRGAQRVVEQAVGDPRVPPGGHDRQPEVLAFLQCLDGLGVLVGTSFAAHGSPSPLSGSFPFTVPLVRPASRSVSPAPTSSTFSSCDRSWPIRSRLVCRYRRFSGFGDTGSGTRPVTRSP